MSETHRVVIVGGGFAGLKCALELALLENIRITLIDRHNYQQFQPLLYQVATGILSTTNAAFALRDIFRNFDNVDVQMDEVTSIDLAQRTVHTASGNAFAADFLVLATGSSVNFYGTPGAAEHSLPLYSLTDAEKLRNAILTAFESANRDPRNLPPGALNFVVVGGGPTGVELAGTLSDIIGKFVHNEFRNLDPHTPKVYLIEAAGKVLGDFSPASQAYAAQALQQHNVILRLATAAKEVTSDKIILSDGSTIPTHTVIWAAGVRASAIPTTPPLPIQHNGRVDVEPELTLRGYDNIYVLGDLANALGPDGKPLPQLAAVAQQAGKSCAQNILATIDDRYPTSFAYSDRGILAMIGRNSAVAELGQAHHEFTGPLAFAAWLGVHAVLLTQMRARLEAIVEWSWEYFTSQHPGQIIDR